MTADTVQRGDVLLDQGSWEEARQTFREALAVGESPEALEGLAQSSRWLEDIDTALTSMERAYLLYVERGDDVNAAEAAASLAKWFIDYRGEPAVASGWLQRARHWLKDKNDHPTLILVAGFEAYLAQAYDKDPGKARALVEEALERAERLGDRGTEAIAKAQLGLIRVSQGDVREGMRLLDEVTAAAVAGELGRYESMETYCFLITACERVRDFGRVEQWSRRVLVLATESGSDDLSAFARAQYAHVMIWSGHWTKAEEELTRLVEESEHRPLTAAMGLVLLASLKRRKGLLDESDEVLRRAEGEPYRSGVRHQVLVARAALDLDRGNSRAAADRAERYLRVVSEDDPIDRIDALEVLVRARARLGEQDEAVRAATELGGIADAISTDAVYGAARAAYGIAARAKDDYDTARQALEEAIELYVSAGVVHEEIRARLELAETLVQLGRPDVAADEARTAQESASRLGAAGDVRWGDRVISALRAPKKGTADLTNREVEVLGLLARGRSNAEIADDLFVSVRTVERHVSNIYVKIGVFGPSGRAAAAAYAHQQGIT